MWFLLFLLYGEKGEPGVDKNTNGGVKVSATLYFFLKTEMTNFQSPKQKGKRMLYPYSNKGVIQFSLVVLTYEWRIINITFDFSTKGEKGSRGDKGSQGQKGSQGRKGMQGTCDIKVIALKHFPDFQSL